MNDLKKKTVRGFNWSILKTISRECIAFFVQITLARLITPKEFGLLGMGLIFVGLGRLFATAGVSPTLVQIKQISKETIGSSYVLSTSVGFLLFGFFWFASPFIAEYFNRSEVVEIVRFLAAMFPLQGFSAVPRGLLMRRFQFDVIFAIEMGSYIIGFALVSITMALLGFGIWSIIWGTFVENILTCILMQIYTAKDFSLRCRVAHLKKVTHFSGGIMAINFFSYVASQIDYFVIGKKMSAENLGFYTRAFNLTTLPIYNMSSVLGRVLLSSFSTIQDDKKALQAAFLRATELIALFGFPIITAMIYCSDIVVIGLLGNQWIESIAPFRILCISGLFKFFFHICGGVAKARNRVYTEAFYQSVYAVVLGLSALYGVHYGIVGVSWAVVVASMIFYLLIMRFVLAEINLGIMRYICAFKPGIVMSIVVICCAAVIRSGIYFTITNLSPSIELALIIVVSATALISGLIFIPQRFKGDTPHWIFSIYGNFMPKSIRRYILVHC